MSKGSKDKDLKVRVTVRRSSIRKNATEKVDGRTFLRPSLEDSQFDLPEGDSLEVLAMALMQDVIASRLCNAYEIDAESTQEQVDAAYKTAKVEIRWAAEDVVSEDVAVAWAKNGLGDAAAGIPDAALLKMYKLAHPGVIVR